MGLQCLLAIEKAIPDCGRLTLTRRRFGLAAAGCGFRRGAGPALGISRLSRRHVSAAVTAARHPCLIPHVMHLIQIELDPLRPELEGLIRRAPFRETFGEGGRSIVFGDGDHVIGQGVEGHHFRAGGA